MFDTQQRLHHFPFISSINTSGSLVSLYLIKSQLWELHWTQLSHITHTFLVSVKIQTFTYTILSISVPFLSKTSLYSIAVAFVQSHFIYINCKFYRHSPLSIEKVQRMQTVAARLVGGNIQIPATGLLSHFHWLPVAKRLHFKLATSTYEILTTPQPTYLGSLINYHVPVSELRSSALHKHHQSAARKTVGECAFSFAPPHIYNNLTLSSSSASS
jgi:hypothetical protein